MTRSARAKLFFVAVSATLVSALWWAVVTSGSTVSAASYATLRVPEDADDREIVSALRHEGIDRIVSESTQWILVNDFGDWEHVPLDAFRNRIEDFDPRDDGYADLVRSLFRDGKYRYLYLKRSLGLFGERRFVRSIARALGKREYTLTLGARNDFSPLPLAFFLIAFVVAAFFSGLSLPPLSFAAAAALAAYGPGGLVAAGGLCAAAVPLSRGFAEIFRYGRFSTPERKFPPWLADFFVPAVALSAAAFFAALVGAVPPSVAALSVSALLFLVATSSFFVALRSKRTGHERFQPVDLKKERRTALSSLTLPLVPFAAAATLLFVVGFTAGTPSGGKTASFRSTPTVAFGEAEFEAHQKLQRSFMTSRLLDETHEKGYTSFSIGGDGFAEVSEQAHKVASLKSEWPPAERMLIETGRFRSGSGRGRAAPESATPAARTVVLLLLAVGASLPGALLFGKGRRQTKISASVADKRIAA